jgi:hypothetical protein
MTIFEIIHIFNHSWNKVSYFHWNKYPNKYNDSVISVDIIDRKIDNEILKTTRIITSKIILPDFIKKLIKTDFCYIIENSEINYNDKTLTLKSSNLFFRDILLITEYIKYQSDQTGTKTIMTQKCEISVNIFGGNYLENKILNTISHNSSNGFKAINYFIENELKN